MAPHGVPHKRAHSVGYECTGAQGAHTRCTKGVSAPAMGLCKQDDALVQGTGVQCTEAVVEMEEGGAGVETPAHKMRCLRHANVTALPNHGALKCGTFAVWCTDSVRVYCWAPCTNSQNPRS